MIYSNLRFTEKYPDTVLNSYIHEPHAELAICKRKAIIVCPGGGYEYLSKREGEPVALQYFAAGLNAFVLHYSIGERAANYAPLIEACLAIKYLREHADELYIDKDYVFITGFSAGGHLAAWVGTQWFIPQVREVIGDADIKLCRPTATLPCYPVITSRESYIHKGSMYVLNGYSVDAEGISRFSLEDKVSEKTSPAFLWHTAEDAVVPIENSLLYASALAKHSVPFELHVYPSGCHGLSLCNKETWANNPDMIEKYNADWIKLALKWVCECPFEKNAFKNN